MNSLKNILTNWKVFFEILTIIVAMITAFFAYLSIKKSTEMSSKQIEFSKNINEQEIMLGRPLISCSGNIGILNEQTFNLNINLKNIGKRSLSNFTIEYFVISKSELEIISEVHEKYLIANPIDSGSEQTFFERLPRSNSQKEVFYKIKLSFEDSLTKKQETQEFYFLFPKEQQDYLEKKLQETVGLFGATIEDKNFIDNELKKRLF